MIRVFLRRIFIAVAIIGSVTQSFADQLTTIRIGVPDQSAGSKPFIAGPVGMAYMHHQLEDQFAAQGIHIQWQFFKGAGPAINEALANRQLDFVYLGDLAAIIGKANGLPTRLLLGNRGSDAYLAVTKASKIKTLADLTGKRVAVYRGTADQLAFDRTLRTAGLSEQNLHVINLDWNASKAALAAGRIDAVWGGMSLLALRNDSVDVVVKSSDFGRQNTTQAGFLGTQAFIDAWPAVTQQLINTLVKDAAEISQSANISNWTAEMAEQSHLPQALFIESLPPQNLNFNTSPRLDPFLVNSFRESIQQAQASGLIRKPFAVEQWIDNQFVDQALHSLKLDTHWPSYNIQGDAQSPSN